MTNTTNVGYLAGIRCPRCLENERFGVQITSNVTFCDDGADVMGRQPTDDVFPDHPIDEQAGFRDEDPIVCRNRSGLCRHVGTVAEFRLGW
ncbi:hypothetical protein [Amycolatopsis sp. CA-230715]|uniref:hypothetical protein n=1 Tax=Amycolatopsis sp. CA-230715 TaxID=2745196 RepID=UPI001C00B2C6|nr:hypothetical protein [Amycolatopsis sp. CA-230715]QWF85753.1 hypothetical protein HUW46_09233 [Amycolatopsis sp. CA-230715]